MHQHFNRCLLGLLTVGALFASGCSLLPKEGDPTSETTSATGESQTSIPAEQPGSEPSSPSPSATAQTQTSIPAEQPGSEPSSPSPSATAVPEIFSANQCADRVDESCLEPLNEAPQGAAPPQSKVTTNTYSYTVKEYVEWILEDLHKKWTQWFTENNFAEPVVYFKVVYETDPAYVMNCGSTVVPHDHPNAYYCSRDPYNVANGSDNGTVIFPVTTMQRMWKGDVLGRTSMRVGDFAAAVIVAHEYGHSVQDELSIQWERFYPGQVPAFTGSNKEAIADCFAGVWMTTAYYEGMLEPGDVDEAVAALNAIASAQAGSSHPVAEERRAALMLGYLGTSGNGGDPMECVDRYWR
ncbi:neutral zinc metallopeptidase [Arthrobacter zhaoxinii]|uniref:Neutral zinc metallopeptidase n=1 Tax=Arthrobacter zhaoxinii TaxID=2964616 RepID=A0ABY5YMR0_9MICC|nr:neutral zinc metallopeptidase [Arthrobacter zhaoxinii]UWX95978.1 neutral zinc metallopeptidase [Arthrobacter zhaoxinii]